MSAQEKGHKVHRKVEIWETKRSKTRRQEQLKNMLHSFGLEFNRIRHPENRLAEKREELAQLYAKQILYTIDKN